MISQRELRIGNLIYPVNDIEECVVVTDIDYDGRIGTTAFFHNGKGTADTVSESAYGITLTPEWLQKCGFIDPIGNEMAYRMNINGADELCWYVQDGYLRYQTQGSGFTRRLQHIRHVHQLQNWYFAFVGIELTIKEKI